MKNYNFERVYGAENGEQVEIHSKNRGFHIVTKLLCLILAFAFWLVVTNVRLNARNESDDFADDLDVESVD